MWSRERKVMKIWGKKPRKFFFLFMGIKGTWNHLSSLSRKKNPKNNNNKKFFHFSELLRSQPKRYVESINHVKTYSSLHTTLGNCSSKQICIRTQRINFWLQVSGAIVWLKLLKTTESTCSETLFSAVPLCVCSIQSFLAWINTLYNKTLWHTTIQSLRTSNFILCLTFACLSIPTSFLTSHK